AQRVDGGAKGCRARGDYGPQRRGRGDAHRRTDDPSVIRDPLRGAADLHLARTMDAVATGAVLIGNLADVRVRPERSVHLTQQIRVALVALLRPLILVCESELFDNDAAGIHRREGAAHRAQYREVA